MSHERLQKLMAAAGIASRRAAEEMIVAGRVSVNGTVVTELGTRGELESDDIRVDGEPLHKPARHTYVALNKPAGYVTTAADEHDRRTVFDLLPDILPRLVPVGRLDMDSEGLLLLTDDGELTNRLTHPRYEVEKEYLALVRGTPSKETLDRLRYGGVVLDGVRTAPALVRPFDNRGRWATDRGGMWLRIGLREGRNRQVRRMCEAVGHEVLRLRRVRIGSVRLGDLPAGEWRPLTVREIAQLREPLVATSSPSPAARTARPSRR